MTARKLLCSVILVGWVALSPVMLGLMFSIRHHFDHRLSGASVQLPRLTEVALDLLGNAQLEGSSHLIHWTFTGFVIVVPLILLIPIWRSSERLALVEVVLFGGGTYLVIVGIVVGLIVCGLALPFLSL